MEGESHRDRGREGVTVLLCCLTVLGGGRDSNEDSGEGERQRGGNKREGDRGEEDGGVVFMRDTL